MEILTDHYISQIEESGQGKNNKIGYLLRKLISEAFSEFEIMDTPPEMLEYYLMQSSAMMWWAATGQRLENIPLPRDFVPDSELDHRDIPRLTQAELRQALIESGERVMDGPELREQELAALEAADDE